MRQAQALESIHDACHMPLLHLAFPHRHIRTWRVLAPSLILQTPLQVAPTHLSINQNTVATEHTLDKTRWLQMVVCRLAARGENWRLCQHTQDNMPTSRATASQDQFLRTYSSSPHTFDTRDTFPSWRLHTRRRRRHKEKIIHIQDQ